MVTILTATIPCLRPLYNKLRGRSRDDSYNKKPRIIEDKNGSYQLKNFGVDKCPLKLGPHTDYATTTVAGGNNDDQSDKSILERTDKSIVRTDAVTVQVEYEDTDLEQKKPWPGMKTS